MPTALVTGASSGLGREFARIHAKRDRDLVITARRGVELEALKRDLEGAHDCRVTVVEADLAAPDGVDTLVAGCEGIEIGVLINNAGFGAHGPFLEQPLERSRTMIELNIMALSALAYRFAPAMVARGAGRILNVGSTAGYLPGPLQAVYYASKAYVNSFSQALAEELDGSGVTVTLLAPGPVKTGFTEAANLEGLAAFENAAEPATVARAGYEAMMRGELVCIDDRRLAAISRVLGLFPRKTVLKLSRRSMTKSDDA